jgi:GNAT superfamily N-acetyltransferase
MNGITTPPVFTRLNRGQVHTLLEWAAAEGWNPGINDADLFFDTDPEGFYGYFEADQLIAGGALVAYGDAFGFMGLFIVHPDHRGTGLGRSLWYRRRDTLLARLHDNAAIGMDGVVAMQDFYHAGGFRLAFRDERYETTGRAFPSDPNIFSLQSADIDHLLQLDMECFGFKRREFILAWIAQPEAKVFQYGTGAGFQGYAVMRKAQDGWKTGPLFATSRAAAEGLYAACHSAVPGEKIYLDVPGANPAAKALAQAFGGTFVFECGRMYYGHAPELPVHQIYGITSFELG